MRQFVTEREETPRSRLLSCVDEDDRVRGVRQAKAAAVLAGETVLQDSDVLVFDFLAYHNVKGTRIFGPTLVLQ